MQLILLEDIRNLGKIGEVVNVKDGYGRNLRIRTGKALRADKSNIDFVNKKKEEINRKNVELKKEAKKTLEKIKNKKIIFKKETKENGDLFASIKQREISKNFEENFKVLINPSQIDLKQEINKIGKFSFTVSLHSNVVAELHVLVEKKDSK